MNLTIKPLTPDLTAAYLDYFDNRAFCATDVNGPCFCTCPQQTTQEIDQMVGEFGDDIKVTLRRYAAKLLDEGKIHGYFAFDGDDIVGWCNAQDMTGYAVCRYSFVPDFARDNAAHKTMSVVCFSVVPEYRGKGVSSALLSQVVADAEKKGYAAVEGYAHTQTTEHNDFSGPMGLYEKQGFIPVAEHDGVVIMRKTLRAK